MIETGFAAYKIVAAGGVDLDGREWVAGDVAVWSWLSERFEKIARPVWL